MNVTDILDAINLRLIEKWKDRTVYVDVCPIDFKRPSFWLSVEKNEFSDANRFLVKRSLQIRLTLYDEKDEHYEASWYRLSKDADAAMKLLMPPLNVAGRHLTMSLKALPRDPDRAYIQINLTWMENRPGSESSDQAPTAEHYHIRESVK